MHKKHELKIKFVDKHTLKSKCTSHRHHGFIFIYIYFFEKQNAWNLKVGTPAYIFVFYSAQLL